VILEIGAWIAPLGVEVRVTVGPWQHAAVTRQLRVTDKRRWGNIGLCWAAGTAWRMAAVGAEGGNHYSVQ
jgi:hypothetical protein